MFHPSLFLSHPLPPSMGNFPTYLSRIFNEYMNLNRNISIYLYIYIYMVFWGFPSSLE